MTRGLKLRGAAGLEATAMPQETAATRAQNHQSLSAIEERRVWLLAPLLSWQD